MKLLKIDKWRVVYTIILVFEYVIIKTFFYNLSINMISTILFAIIFYLVSSVIITKVEYKYPQINRVTLHLITLFVLLITIFILDIIMFLIIKNTNFAKFYN